MIAGIMILSTKQLQIGDTIELQSDNYYFGTIEEITIRNTIIRTLDMRQVILPNMTMISKPIKTFSAEEIVRLDGAVQVDYETDLALAQQVIKDSIGSIQRVKATDQARTMVSSFDDSGITIKYFYYFDPKAGLIGDYAMGVVNEAIRNGFSANNISIPFPHRTLVTKE
jgi:small conductance mechanosensitive channel